jgi:2-oxoglutarate/2-oxoacid ferredoxin oxidoreductase subunit beta
MAEQTLTKADFQSGAETRWCPGCGDYAILATVQAVMPEFGIAPHKTVFMTGIGCAGRFSYYMDTYGMHGIHGRAPALATGLAVTDPSLSVWVVSGDGDALSIGAGQLLHAIRRNVPLKILLFNNEIYGLTKGQASPTSPVGQVTKSTPRGSTDRPFAALPLALGAGATFLARARDNDRKELAEVLRAAAAHEGTALVEVLQNCPVFNDGAHGAPPAQDEHRHLRLRAGQPLEWGPEDDRRALLRTPAGLRVGRPGEGEVAVHDPAAADPAAHFGLARVGLDAEEPIPLGVLRQVAAPTFVPGGSREVDHDAREARLAELLAGRDSWTVA